METALNLGNANVISVLWVIVVKWLVTVMDIQIVLVANKERNVWNVKITLWEINANTASPFSWETQAMEVIAYHAWNFAMDTANFATILTTSMGLPLHNFMRKTPDGRNSLWQSNWKRRGDLWRRKLFVSIVVK